MAGVAELDRIFNTVSVCRTFRLNGLQEILRRTQLNIKPVALLYQIGDLSNRGYFDTNVANYIVDHQKAKNVIPTLHDPSSIKLHKEWRAWYQEEFRRYFKPDDLAELLYHEAELLYHEVANLSEPETRLEELQTKTLGYVWEYHDSLIVQQQLDLKKSFEYEERTADVFVSSWSAVIARLSEAGDDEKLYEVQQYLPNLQEFIEDKKLNRFDEILGKDYAKFLEFLGSLHS